MLLVGAGLGFRALADYLDRGNKAPPLPPGALASIPHEIGDWTGRDEALSERVRIATDTDDLVNREYRNSMTGDLVGFYVAYGGQARDLEPHRPEVCYPGNGWTPGKIEYTELTVELPPEGADTPAASDRVGGGTGTSGERGHGSEEQREPVGVSNAASSESSDPEQSGGVETFKLPCRILTFSRGGFDLRTIVVVNYYIVDGKYWADVELLRELSAWGSHNVQYMAQVQVTSTTSGFRDVKAATAAAMKFAAASAEAVRKAVSPPASVSASPLADSRESVARPPSTDPSEPVARPPSAGSAAAVGDAGAASRPDAQKTGGTP